MCKDAVRNDMQKLDRHLRGNTVVRNDMQKIAALLRVQEGACRGKSATAHEFALSATFPYLSLRGNGLPRRFAPRNDMQKFAACSHCKDALGQKRGTFHP